jgi:hypothetical protein
VVPCSSTLGRLVVVGTGEWSNDAGETLRSDTVLEWIVIVFECSDIGDIGERGRGPPSADV